MVVFKEGGMSGHSISPVVLTSIKGSYVMSGVSYSLVYYK